MKIGKVISNFLEYNKNDKKCANHALKVYAYAEAIASQENLKNQGMDTLKTATIFHDIGIPEAERMYHKIVKTKTGKRIGQIVFGQGKQGIIWS